MKISENRKETYALIPVTLAESYTKHELNPTFPIRTKTLTYLCRYAAITLGGIFRPSSQ